MEQQGTNSNIVLQILISTVDSLPSWVNTKWPMSFMKKPIFYLLKIGSTGSPNHLRLQTLANNDAELLRYELAEQRFQDVTTLVTAVGAEALPTINVLEDLARLYQRQGKLRPALEPLGRVMPYAQRFRDRRRHRQGNQGTIGRVVSTVGTSR